MSTRAFPTVLLCSALLLAGCGPQPSIFGGLGDQTLDLKRGSSAPLTAEFQGHWDIENVPAWIHVTPTSGDGPMNLNITVDRRAGTPLTADQAVLNGSFKVQWTNTMNRAGTATVSVRAEQYRLAGRVTTAVTKTAGTDTRLTGLPSSAPVTANGVIVKYRASGTGVSTQGTGHATSVVAITQATATLRGQGLQIQEGRDLGAATAVVRVNDVNKALVALRADPNVMYAVPNTVLHVQQTAPRAALSPTDQYATLQWPFRMTGYQAVWRDMESGGYTKPVTVAVLDTGTRFDHPDLRDRQWGPSDGALDVVNDVNGDGNGPDRDPTDPTFKNRTEGSHGTHVAGLIVARWGENGPSCNGCSTSGVVGASRSAPVKVLPVRVIDALGNAELADVITGIRYAAGLPVTLAGVTYKNPHPAQVLNLSLGGAITAEEAVPMCEAVTAARQAGALVIVAGGNAGTTAPYYPAACADAVAVASVQPDTFGSLKHARYSNEYAQIMLSAPGGTDAYADVVNGSLLNGSPFPDMVFSTSWNYVKNEPTYEAQSGTSQAAPQVAALAALLLSKGVTSGPADTLTRLTSTARDLGPAGRDPTFGFGVIDAAKALNAPAVSGLRIVDDRARNLLPRLQSTGTFEAWLGDGAFTVIAGTDVNANGVFGEADEPRTERKVTLGGTQTDITLPDLVLP